MSQVLKILERTLVFEWFSTHSVSRQTVSIFLMWLFTLSALIGISLGMQDWFIPKTPLNLLLCFALMVINVPIKSMKGISLFFVCFIAGMVVEILGVHSGAIFGDYIYGNNMGIKILGVPVMIGIYWAILVMVTNQIARLFFTSLISIVITASLLMIGLDFLMEQLASTFDFWHFRGGVAGLQNYAAWFGLAFILNIFASKMLNSGGTRFSVHLYLNQLLFFGLSYFILLF